MVAYNNTWKNKLWLGWFVLQLPITLFIDLLELVWPAWMYEPAGAPLHFFHAVKTGFIETYNDPIVQWTPESASGHDSWMGLFLWLELLYLLPMALYGVYRLGVQRRGTSGADELLFLVYFAELAFTTLVCLFDSFYWDNSVYTSELKWSIRQLYAPWIIVPSIGVIDMATRILGRIRVADAVLEARKSQ